MRSLKRVLSLALVLVMVLSMVTVASAAVADTYEEITDKGDIKNELAVSLLVDLGVINGYDDGSYRPTNTVTRAEFAKLAVYMLVGADAGANLAASTAYSSYNDVLNSNAVWAAGYIEYLTGLGAVAGKGDGGYDPSATVTAQEAAKILIAILGYNTAKEGLTGPNWAINTNVIAQNEGIYDGYTGGVAKALTRDEAALLIFNALSVSQRVISTEGVYSYKNLATSTYSAAQTSTRLYELGLVKTTGYLVGNEYAAIVDNLASEGNSLVLTGYDDNGEPVIVERAVASTVDQIGAEVAFYAYRSNLTRIFSSMVAKTGKTAVVAVDTAGTTYNAMKSSVTYERTGTDINVYANFDVTNGTSIDLADLSSTATNGLLNATTQAKFIPGKGKIVTYYDLDGDSRVDTINVITYSFSQVTNKSASASTITVAGLNGKGDLTSNVISSDFVVSGFDDVARNDNVLYYVAGEYIIDIQVAPTVKGSMTSNAAAFIRIDGTQTYKSAIEAASSAVNTAFDTVALGTDALFYLDLAGYVVAATADTTSSSNYLYVLAAEVAYNPGGLVSAANTFIALKVVLSDGTQKIIDVALTTANSGVVYLTGGHAGTYANSTATTGTDNPTLMSNIYGNNATTAAAKFVGNIYSYTVNSNGAYIIAGTSSNVASLNTVTPVTGTIGNNTGTIAKNKATIGSIASASGVANVSTTLVFLNDAKTALNASYTGIANFPTYNPTTSVAVKAVVVSNRIVFAVVEGAYSGAVADGYAVYIGVGETTSAGTYHTLLIAGTKTDVLIEGTTPTAGVAYGYTVSGGVYNLDSTFATVVTGKTVGVLDDGYAVLGGALVYFADAYYVYDATTTPKYGDTSLAVDQTVTYYTNSDGELVVAIVTANS